MILLLLSLLLCLAHASSFSLTQFSPVAASSSSSSLQHAYHFGAGAVNTEKPALAKQQPYASYVPDGLSEEEYKRIKNEESRKQQKLNYGAWGPRFVSSIFILLSFHLHRYASLPHFIVGPVFLCLTETSR